MSGASSNASSVASDTAPNMTASMLTPPFLALMSPTIPEPLIKPMGKYHPANYQSPNNTEVSSPTSHPAARSSMPPNNLTIPPLRSRKSAQQGPDRKNIDIKKKLQQYQRDMIAQAKAATEKTKGNNKSLTKKPDSPRLTPTPGMMSPGAITPLELEESRLEGYLAAGRRNKNNIGTLVLERRSSLAKENFSMI